MMRPARRGLTLIELLIVVAVMSILTASTLAFITGPMHDERIATREAAQEAQLTSFFARLTAEVHRAESVEAGEAFVLLRGASVPPGEDETLVYYRNAAGTIMRVPLRAGAAAAAAAWAAPDSETPAEASPVVEGVRVFACATEPADLLRVMLTPEREPGRPVRVREVALAVGLARGGQP